MHISHHRAVQAPPEFVFVIDCSGSMNGGRIQAARAALQLAVRSMPSGSRFQVRENREL